MDEHYCPYCGAQHGGETEARAEEAAVGEITDAQVRIAEINADKEIRLAKIAAGVIDAERDIEAARTEGRADALESVLTPPEPEPLPEPAPIVVQDVQEDDTEEELPPRGDSAPMPRQPAKNKSYFGF